MDYSREMEETEVKQLIGESLTEYGKECFLSLKEKEKLGKELFYAIRKLDILQEILEDTEITEIMINGPDHIFIEKMGSCFLGEIIFLPEKSWKTLFNRSLQNVTGQ